jgi:hypothetical protein
MAYTFSRSPSRYLLALSAPVTAAPLTISAWSYPTSAVRSTFVSINNSAYSCSYDGGTRCGDFTLAAYSPVNICASADISGPIPGGVGSQGNFVYGATPLNTWQHIAGVYSASNNRRAYWNGIASAAPATGNYVPVALSRLIIGLDRVTSPQTTDFQHVGRIAEVGIWKAALTADEVTSLAAGMSPELVRPQSLVFYAPLLRDLNDRVSKLTLTNVNGALVSDHPRIFT